MANLEYIDGKLVVDELIIDPSLPRHVVIRIDGEFFMLANDRPESARVEEKDLRPYKKKPDANWYRPTTAWQFWISGLVPRGGYQIDLGRPITEQEWDELVEEHGLTEDDISPVFTDTKGGIFGKQYELHFRARQVRLKTPAEAMELEQRLQGKGIEASSGSPARVNIRVEPLGE